MIRVFKTSQLTGQTAYMDLPISGEMYLDWLNTDQHVQDFFPQLNDDQREFLITGITPEEWDEYMGEEE